MVLNVVTVIGATGTMGANVAGIFASFGNAKVYLVGRDISKVRNTIPRIIKSVRADSIEKNLIPADFSTLEECVRESDLIFESAAEDMGIKEDIARTVAGAMRKDAISCTGTSGLSVTRLAECYPEGLRERFLGMHFFNPPYNMPLCELIPTKYSDSTVVSEVSEYLKSVLLRTVVPVKDSPAFLGNRIGFQFINEALQYAERYKDYGGIDYIDAILGSFTGRSMAPLVTSDFVGLDVHKAIVDNVYQNTNDYAHETFVLPAFVQKLIDEKKLGRKTNAGLYRLSREDNGSKRQMVLDLNTGAYRELIPYAFPFADKMKKYIAEGDYAKAFERLVNNRSQEAEICLSFLLKYIVYSLYAAKEVGDSVHSADDVMATGFNWCPPLAMVQALSTVADVKALIRERLSDVCDQADVEELLESIEPSVYDYRPYLKSAR